MFVINFDSFMLQVCLCERVCLVSTRLTQGINVSTAFVPDLFLILHLQHVLRSSGASLTFAVGKYD